MAIAIVRPLTGVEIPLVCPFGIGAGPIGVQAANKEFFSIDSGIDTTLACCFSIFAIAV